MPTSTIGEAAPPPPLVDNPAFWRLFFPAPRLVRPYYEVVAAAIHPFHARCDPSPLPIFSAWSDLDPETRIADAAHATFRAAAIASFWDMDVYGPPELLFGAYFDHTRANWNYVWYRRVNETWVPQDFNLRTSLVALADRLDVALAVFELNPDGEAEQMVHTLIETEQSLHFPAQTGVRFFMHLRVLAQGYCEGCAYPAPHRSRSANPWESVYLLLQSWIDPRADWPDNTVGWNLWDRSFNIQRFLAPLDMYTEHGEWDPKVEYEEGAIASAHFLEGEELRDLALELDEDASFVYGLPDPNPAAPLPSPASSEDEGFDPRVEIAPASSSLVGAVPQVDASLAVLLLLVLGPPLLLTESQPNRVPEAR
ncbi:hypothetical protein B0H17DRAFT_1193427 [Mycena rosella]|uniref:Uncharacterized protein n=1 Tax=Mycena rosella TaxID=1033263 RepID=A0AAD7GTQ7_MYCRO|nr:hypothetical protein B0H17DRAFT_1193427 [Mycena rosella]